MRQRRKITQLQIFIARNIVNLADGREHLRLLDCVDAQVRFQIQIQSKHVERVTGFLYYQGQDALLHRIARGCRGFKILSNFGDARRRHCVSHTQRAVNYFQIRGATAR